MSLGLVMFVKALVLLAWAFISEWLWPEKKSLDKEGGGYTPGYSPLRLPAPKDTTDSL